MEFRDETRCLKCRDELVKTPNMFGLPETGPLPGMVCTVCNTLHESKEWREALYWRQQTWGLARVDDKLFKMPIPNFAKDYHKDFEHGWNYAMSAARRLIAEELEQK